MKRHIKRILLSLGIIVLAGCSNTTEVNQVDASSSIRMDKLDNTIFEVIDHQKLDKYTNASDDEIYILKDKATGKKYILFKGYRKAGLTPLQ